MSFQPRHALLPGLMALAFAGGMPGRAGAAPTITLQSATGSACVYSGLTTDASGNITVTCASQPDGIMTVTPNRIVEGAAASIHLDCGSNGLNQFYLYATGLVGDTTSWTNGTQMVLDCSTATKNNDVSLTAARNQTADADRVITLTLSTAASGGGTVKATAPLTVLDDMAVLNALAAPTVWANTQTAMTATGALGVGATPSVVQGTYGNLYVDASGKWTYVVVPGRATVPAGTTVNESFSNVGGSGRTVTIAVAGADALAPAVPPTAPVIGTATPGNQSASVGFTATTSWGSAAGGVAASAGNPAYTATCTSSNGGALGTGTGNAPPVTVGSLTNDKTYTCTVKATNSVGASSADSAASAAIVPTLGSAPNTPTIGTATQASSTGISVNFTPAGSGATATDFRATCTSSNGGAQGIATGSASPVTVDSLTTDKTYTCVVEAHNAAGYSAASSASNSVTLTASSCSTPTYGSSSNDTTWNMATWTTSGLFPSFTTQTTATGDTGTAVRFTAVATPPPGGANGVSSNGVTLDYQAVAPGTGIEAVISACPHDFVNAAYGTAAEGQPCYKSFSGNVGNERYLKFDGTHPAAYDCTLNPGQTYYINFRALFAPRGTVTTRFQITPR